MGKRNNIRQGQDYVSCLYAEGKYPTTANDIELDVDTAFAYNKVIPPDSGELKNANVTV